LIAWPYRGALRPWVYGHRGVVSGVPENTLLAVEQALAQGADGIEFDVQLSQDGAIVVFHDVSLERMTAGHDNRLIADVSEFDLCRIPLGQGATIPRFRDVLTWADPLDVYLNIELKADAFSASKLLAALSREIFNCASDAVKSRLLFSSFSAEIIDFARERSWPWPLAQLLGAGESDQFNVDAVSSCGIHAHLSLMNEVALRKCQTRKTFINVWTVNSAQEAKRLACASIDGIITDEPQLVRGAIE
jgi:glycerophosphoryl diester phosphodiesterase